MESRRSKPKIVASDADGVRRWFAEELRWVVNDKPVMRAHNFLTGFVVVVGSFAAMAAAADPVPAELTGTTGPVRKPAGAGERG